VIGAYSRTRASQILFGGVTQHFLAHADIPVLLAH
jgi:nucleotide-binding universal stress UspA family protein